MGQPYQGCPRHRGDPGLPSCSFGKGCRESQKETGRDEEKKGRRRRGRRGLFFHQCELQGQKKKQRSKSTKKAALEKAAGSALEKAKGDEPALEKAEAEGTIRRGRRAKHGQKELLMEKEEEEELPLEKGKKTKQEQDVSLEKGTKTQKKSLEKDPQGVVLKPAAKNPPKAKLVPAEKPLEKGKEEKAICVVDWHHTLEVRDMVPESHIKALRGLVKATKEVHIVSYVESEKGKGRSRKMPGTSFPRTCSSS